MSEVNSFLQEHPRIRWICEHLLGLWVGLVLTPSVIALLIWVFITVGAMA